MAKFFPPWPDSQKPLISVWKHLGSFSLSRGNKIGLIWRYSEDWPFHKAQELLLTLLSVLQGEQQLCPPAHPHCWRGSPGLSTSTSMNWQPLAFAATSLSSSSKAKDLESDWVLLGFLSHHSNSTAGSWFAVLPPKVCSHHPPVALSTSVTPSPVLQHLHLYLVPDWVLIDLVWYS